MSSAVTDYSEKRIRQVITPEGIALPFTIASRGARIGALLLDLFFVQVAQIVIFLLLLWIAMGLIGVEGDLDNPGPAIEAIIVFGILTFFAMRYAISCSLSLARAEQHRASDCSAFEWHHAVVRN